MGYCRELSSNIRRLSNLLNFLQNFFLLSKKDGCYQNVPFVGAFFLYYFERSGNLEKVLNASECRLSVEVVREDIREEKTFQMYIARSGKWVDPCPDFFPVCNTSKNGFILV